MDNPLSRFLIERGIRNQEISKKIFWHLKSEIDDRNCLFFQRFYLLLESLLLGIPFYRNQLLKQKHFLKFLVEIHQQFRYDRNLKKGLNEKLENSEKYFPLE